MRGGGNGPIGVRGAIATVLVLAFGGTAPGQSNSLFARARQATPAGAPAAAPGTRAGAGYRALSPLSPLLGGSVLNNQTLLDTSLYAVRLPDVQRIRVNDLLTVIVREDRKSVSNAKLEHEKNWELDSELTAWLRINAENKLVPQRFPEGNPKVSFEYDSQYDGKGKHERTDSLITRIAVKVIDIRPNGNLIIQGRKELRIGEEKHVATLTGECSADDVTPQRTVLSTQIYDLRIDMPDAGAVNDATRRGWLLKLLDAARPF